MGIRLRTQLMVIFVGLLSIALAIVAYFNVGVFRLSFLADEEQRLRYLGQRAADRVLESLAPLGADGQAAAEGRTSAHIFFEQPEFPGLRYFEVWDHQGLTLFRSGEVSEELPGKEVLQAQMRFKPLPTHLFWDRRLADEQRSLPYLQELPLQSSVEPGAVTYEVLYPIFSEEPFDARSSAGLQGVLHLSFQVDNVSRRLRLVTGGNVLLALTFLLTSLMAVHLWSQHAIQRPLEGLVDSMRQLDTGASGRELASSNELINLSQTLHALALERLKYQRELEQLNRDLEAQVEEKTREMKEFFSLVTHDLRIPLAAIQGYCDLLKRKPEQLSERHLTYVTRAATANNHALELVRNLLEAMKIEFGTLQPVMESFDFEELAQEVSHELNVDESLPEVRLKLHGEEAGSVQVDADRTRIKRVLTNLLSNAQKHANETKEVLLRWQPQGGVLKVWVEDSGPGIPPEQLRRLFQKFSKVTDHGGNPGGLGLGLYIVSRILDSHGRTIEVESEVGKGTKFHFSLSLSSQEESQRKESFPRTGDGLGTDSDLS